MAEVDVDDENILHLLFRNSFPDAWLSDSEFVKYLMELSSYGLHKLAEEPERLAWERTRVVEETQELAFHHYNTFIQSANCCKEIFQDFKVVEHHLDEFLSKLPTFFQECDGILQKTKDLSSSRRLSILTLQRHTQLLEILEMPQLMDTCVRNAYYDEALDLAGHVRRLERKHSNIPIIANMAEEVRSSCQLMLHHLMLQLQAKLQLPVCLRIIGYLRRMDVFSEPDLRIRFLQARDTWFQVILESIPFDDAYTHITKTIEASRIHLFDIMTQFRAIFSDENPVGASTYDDVMSNSVLFHGWVVEKISQFFMTLERDLTHGVKGRLDSLLSQCMYFGLSFSRVGIDFRGMVGPCFERAALLHFKTAVGKATYRFEESMHSYNLLGLSSTLGTGYELASQLGDDGEVYPPAVLLNYYPLAAYCNGFLAACNDLLLCCPVSLAYSVVNVVRQSLFTVNTAILEFHRCEKLTFNDTERVQFGQFCVIYVSDLLPYINRCLRALFPATQLSQTLGVPLADLSRLGNPGIVDLNPISEQVAPFLPDTHVPVVSSLGLASSLIGCQTKSHFYHHQSLENGTEMPSRGCISNHSVDVDVELHPSTRSQLQSADHHTGSVGIGLSVSTVTDSSLCRDSFDVMSVTSLPEKRDETYFDTVMTSPTVMGHLKDMLLAGMLTTPDESKHAPSLSALTPQDHEREESLPTIVTLPYVNTDVSIPSTVNLPNLNRDVSIPSTVNLLNLSRDVSIPSTVNLPNLIRDVSIPSTLNLPNLIRDVSISSTVNLLNLSSDVSIPSTVNLPNLKRDVSILTQVTSLGVGTDISLPNTMIVPELDTDMPRPTAISQQHPDGVVVSFPMTTTDFDKDLLTPKTVATPDFTKHVSFQNAITSQVDDEETSIPPTVTTHATHHQAEDRPVPATVAASDLTCVTVPGLTCVTTPDLTCVMAPDLTCVMAPDLTCAMAPDLTSVTVQALTSVTAPDLTCVTAPDFTCATAPDLTAVAIPDITCLTAPDLTSVTAPDLTCVTTPDLTSVTAPDLTCVTAPDFTCVAAPDLTAVAVPDVTYLTAPDHTSVTAPDLTCVTTPDLTCITAPDLTCVTTPDFTYFTAPDLTAVTVPGVTCLTAPELTSVAVPDLTCVTTPDLTCVISLDCSKNTSTTNNLATGVTPDDLSGDILQAAMEQRKDTSLSIVSQPPNHPSGS